MTTNDILKEIQKVDTEVNTPVSFLAQSNYYNVSELNAIRFFALNLLQSKMRRQLKKEGSSKTYNNSFNTHLVNTKY